MSKIVNITSKEDKDQKLLQRNLQKVSLRSTELYRIHYMKVTLIN